ncbi:AcvB/VirJ family lysyl-phosphatidylglycerol hydrolase [Pseudomonas batumici]|uniref:Virulence protein n=1 Tax=Pseudomonas batumici TaxID=226910 RepID=A0A0C2ET36_9PSED|nr:AcvB/VirJ family lysyl-phosphatidylglycerol hydrolase [Pseudomonas batumici]KIH81708.1 Virulence protein [Pseudomonas batumici]
MLQPWSTSSLEQSLTVMNSSQAECRDSFAIFYSGDAGWGFVEQQLSQPLNEHGIAVLGIDTKAYFWNGRSPESAVNDLSQLITHYREHWHKSHVWLIGYSFGANVLPSLIERLPAEERSHVLALTLLGPTQDIFFEVELENYMRQSWLRTQAKRLRNAVLPVRHYDALPPLNNLRQQLPIACYFGTSPSIREADRSLCETARLPSWIKATAYPGGHNFGDVFQPVAAQMLRDVTSTTNLCHG